MNDYVTFRRMITPVIIQIVFWITAVVFVIAGFALLADDKTGQGLLLILLGPLGARIYAEILIVIFKINDNVSAIRALGEGRDTPAPTVAPPTQPTQPL